MTRRIKSGDTLFDAIHAVLELGPVGVTELAEHVDVPKSTMYEYLKTLEHHDYVVKRDGKYRLSFRFLNVGGRVRNATGIYQAAESELVELANKTGSNSGLVVEENGRGILLASNRSADATDLPFEEYPGLRMHLHSSAAGKAILAHLGDDRVDEIVDEHGLPGFTEETVTSREALETELERVRSRGFAVSRGERIKGLYSVAAPVIDIENNVRGSVGVYGPTGNLEEDYIEETAQIVVQASTVVEMNLDHELEGPPQA